MRIDLGRPMAKGNLILMKGNRKQGKSTVALSTVKQFVQESKNHKAIYVGFQKKHGEQLIQ